MRVMLADGQGNFGSVDGDPPAAMRYTEVRLAKPAMALLEDIDRDTVDFQENYDGSEKEPRVLPARFPNLLVNGAGGIAVGMATNIPPHNLGEVIDGCIAYIDDPSISIDDLIALVPGPDFPTAGTILGRAGIRAAYNTGRGSIIMRAKSGVEDDAQGARGDRLHRDPVSGEQGDPRREDRRARAREEARGHLRPARRIRPRRHAHRRRAEARRHGRRGAQPALPLHAPADLVRRQHGGAQRRPSGGPQPQGPDPRLRRVPRGGRQPAHQVPAQQGARARPRPVRPRHRGRQYRRGDPPDPRRARPEHGARAVDGAPLAGRRTSRRSSPSSTTRATGSPRTAPTACPTRRRAPSSICACSASRPSAATRSATS